MNIQHVSGTLRDSTPCIQVFYRLEEDGYSPKNSFYIASETTTIITVEKSGRYLNRLDNDYTYDNGGVVKIKDFWIDYA